MHSHRLEERPHYNYIAIAIKDKYWHIVLSKQSYRKILGSLRYTLIYPYITLPLQKL